MSKRSDAAWKPISTERTWTPVAVPTPVFSDAVERDAFQTATEALPRKDGEGIEEWLRRVADKAREIEDREAER